MTIGTDRNAERTGKRHVTRLSRIARQVENVRHYDLDLYQVCPECKYPQLFAEVKSYDARDKEWEQTRRHADSYGCLAILVVEIPGREQIGIRKYSSRSGLVTPLFYGAEERLVKILEEARDIHACL